MLQKRQPRKKKRKMRASTKGKARQPSTVSLFVRHQPPVSPNMHPSRHGIERLSRARWDYYDRWMGLGNKRHFDGEIRVIPPAAHSLISWEVLHSLDYLHRLSPHQFNSEFIFGEYGWPRLYKSTPDYISSELSYFSWQYLTRYNLGL